MGRGAINHTDEMDEWVNNIPQTRIRRRGVGGNFEFEKRARGKKVKRLRYSGNRKGKTSKGRSP